MRVRQHLASTCPAPAGSGGTGPTERGPPGASCGEDDSEEVSWENGVLCGKARNRATGRGVEGRETWLGQEWGQEAQLTGGAVGARIARAGTVTLVAVKAEADTDPLVLAWVVTTGVHCRGEAEIRDHLEQPPPSPMLPLMGKRGARLGPWTPVTALS